MNVYDRAETCLSFGVIPTDDMFPETALVKLMCVIGQTDNPQEAAVLLKTNVAGEFFPKDASAGLHQLKEEKKVAIDYVKVGLKVGIEIHQQLNTGSKLSAVAHLNSSRKHQKSLSFVGCDQHRVN